MPVFQPIQHLFQQLTDLIDQLDDNQYAAPCKVLSHSTIGQHVRHVIELFTELNRGYESGCVNYDQRQRNHLIETNRLFAQQQLEEIAQHLDKPNKGLHLAGDYSIQLDSLTDVPTNYYRELIYNFEHTIHHMALIKSGLTAFPEILVAADFGVAVSTLKYRKACAQ